MAEKQFIKAQELLEDSFRLGLKVLDSGFKPDFIVGIWRGGTPVGIAVQELLEHNGIASDHIAIRTSSYEGIEQRGKKIQVHGLNYIVKNADAAQCLLIVDDVYDTGLSIKAIIDSLNAHVAAQHPPRYPRGHRLFQARQQPHRAPARILHPRDRQVAGLSP